MALPTHCRPSLTGLQWLHCSGCCRRRPAGELTISDAYRSSRCRNAGDMNGRWSRIHRHQAGAGQAPGEVGPSVHVVDPRAQTWRSDACPAAAKSHPVQSRPTGVKGVPGISLAPEPVGSTLAAGLTHSAACSDDLETVGHAWLSLRARTRLAAWCRSATSFGYTAARTIADQRHPAEGSYPISAAGARTSAREEFSIAAYFAIS